MRISVSNRVGSVIDGILGDEQQAANSKPMLKDYKKFKGYLERTVLRILSYIEYEVTGSPEQKKKYGDEVIQIPVVRGTVKSTNHISNVLDLIKQMYPKTTTLTDIGIT